MVRRYAAFNPHATFHLIMGESRDTFPATEPTWRKWLPSDPTSPHWYTAERLRSLIVAYLAEERTTNSRARTVREFVSEFYGLKGTAKQKVVTDAAGVSGLFLHDLIDGNDISTNRARALLEAMQEESREVKPLALGVLGEQHLKHCLVRDGVEERSIKYKRIADTAHGIPFVLEAVCGWYGDANRERSLTTGLNFSPALGSPFHELPSLLATARVDPHDPLAVIVHLTSPRLDFTDRGKSILALPSALRTALGEVITSATKHWTKLKRQEDRERRVHERYRERWLRAQDRQHLSVKEAAYQVMEAAYLFASANGTMPANARQIMYAARGEVIRLTGKTQPWKNSLYFTQRLLPNFVKEHPELTKAWQVDFDDRGHLTEPHTGRRLGIGTKAVREYCDTWGRKKKENDLTLDPSYPTIGPKNRYSFVLFVEKEGFDSLLAHAQIQERFDVGLMSTKGMSVTAARQLAEHFTKEGVTLLVLHDFDKSGFSIIHTLRSNTRRYRFKAKPNVVDLGLRLSDVQAMNLQSEAVEYRTEKDPRTNLRENGATEEEISFLVHRWTSSGFIGERVELNAMHSQLFISWLESKLTEAGVKKVVPDEKTLKEAYQRAAKKRFIQAAIDSAKKEFDENGGVPIPVDLAVQIQTRILDTPMPWDEAVWDLTEPQDESAE